MVKRLIMGFILIFFIFSDYIFSENILNKNKMYLYFETGSSINENDLLFFEEIFSDNVKSIEKISLIEFDQKIKVPNKNKKKTEIAKKAGADLWVYLLMDMKDDKLSTEVKLYDILNEKYLIEKQYLMEASLKKVESSFWEDLIDDLKESLVSIKTVNTFGTSFVEIIGLSGTSIKGLSNRIVKIKKNGKAIFPVEGNRSYKFIAQKSGYKTVVKTVYAESGNISFNINQEKMDKHSYSFGMQNGSPTVSFNYFLVPESVYIGSGLTYSGTYIWPELFDVEAGDWLANTLSIHAELGKLIGSDYKKLQFITGIRALFNYMIPSDEYNQSPQVHPLFPFGIAFPEGFKINTGRYSSLNIIFMPTFYLKIKSTKEAELLAAEWEAEADTDLESYPYNGQYQDAGNFVFGLSGSVVFTRTF